MQETENRKPTVVIECPSGDKIKIFQELSPEYIRELIEVFTEKDGVEIR